MAHLVWSAFARLDADSQMRVSDVVFEDPTSMKKVGVLVADAVRRMRLACRGPR